jgi:hypothetical protein
MRRTLKITLAAIGGTTIALAVGCVVLLSAFEDGMCRNTPLQTIKSPDSRLKAVFFERDCGATTSFSSQLSIIASNDSLPNEGGNVFIADFPAGQSAISQEGPAIAISWINPMTIAVTYESSARIFKMNEKVGGIRVTYLKQ